MKNGVFYINCVFFHSCLGDAFHGRSGGSFARVLEASWRWPGKQKCILEPYQYSSWFYMCFLFCLILRAQSICTFGVRRRRRHPLVSFKLYLKQLFQAKGQPWRMLSKQRGVIWKRARPDLLRLRRQPAARHHSEKCHIHKMMIEIMMIKKNKGRIYSIFVFNYIWLLFFYLFGELI